MTLCDGDVNGRVVACGSLGVVGVWLHVDPCGVDTFDMCVHTAVHNDVIIRTVCSGVAHPGSHGFSSVYTPVTRLHTGVHPSTRVYRGVHGCTPGIVQ